MAGIRAVGKNVGKAGLLRSAFYYALVVACTCSGLVFSSSHFKNFEGYKNGILGFFYLPASVIKPIFNLQNKFLDSGSEQDGELKRKKMELFFLNSEFNKASKQGLQFSDFKEVFDNIPKKTGAILFAKPDYYGQNTMINDIIIVVEEENSSFLERVKINDVVLCEKGIFGRVSGISGNKITVISIFSFLSRVPVFTSDSKNYGMAYSDGIQLEFLHPFGSKEKIIDGEEVFTSDENRLITGKIPFGRIKLEGGRALIIPYAEFRPEVVGIVSAAAEAPKGNQ